MAPPYSPLNDPRTEEEARRQAGMASGAPPATTAPNAGYNSFLADPESPGSKAARFERLLAVLGLGNPSNRRSLFGQHMYGLADDYFEPYRLTQHLDGSEEDMEGLFSGFKSTLSSPGGLGKLSSLASDAFNAIDWDLLLDQEQVKTAGQLASLQRLGLSPIVGKTYGNALDDALSLHLGQVANTARDDPEKAVELRFMQYLQSSPAMRRILGLK